MNESDLITKIDQLTTNYHSLTNKRNEEISKIESEYKKSLDNIILVIRDLSNKLQEVRNNNIKK